MVTLNKSGVNLARLGVVTVSETGVEAFEFGGRFIDPKSVVTVDFVRLSLA